MRWIICRARCSSSTCRSLSSSASAPSSRSSCASPPDLAFLRLVFAGTPEFAERALARLLQAGHDVSLVLTQPDRPAGRGLKADMSPVKRFALGRNLEVYQPHSLKTEGSARIRAARPDALVVAAYGLILPQQGVTYASKLGKQETLLDWSRPAVELERAVRAFRPSPGAATLLDGAPLKVWRVAVTCGRGTPGELLSSSDAGLVVAAGKGALAITELQRSGGRRLAAGEFLRGHRLAPGVRFG